MSNFPQIHDDSSLFSITSPLGSSSFVMDSSIKKVLSNAQKSLERAQSLALPSRYLKPSEAPEDDSLDSIARDAISGSTINLSELFPKDCSTPRATDTMMESGRPSLADKFFQMSDCLGSGKANLDEISRKISTLSAPKDSFIKNLSDVEKQFANDEQSWKNEFSIPTEQVDISTENVFNPKESLSTFFEKGNPALSSIFKKSPEPKRPIPLINISCEYDTNDSLSMSKIMKALQDTQMSPDKIVNHFAKRKSSPAKAVKTQRSGTSPPTRDSIKFSKSPDRNKSPSSTRNSLESQHLVKSPLKSYDLNKSPSKSSTNCDKSPRKSPNYNTSPMRPRSSTITSRNSKDSENLEKSLSSIRSSSSLSTLPGGKLPLECSRAEIVWCCTKIGKSDTQTFALRNKSSAKLKIKISVTNPAFKLRDSSDFDFSTSPQILAKFQSFETRNFTITFAPVSIGSAIDVMDLKSLDPQHEQTSKQTIKLSGYGGFAKVNLIDLPKDAAGKYLISLGYTDNNARLENTIRLKNIGDLTAFAYLKQSELSLSLPTDLVIIPSMILLKPQEEINITITYKLKREDVDNVKSKSLRRDLGKISIYHGSEVDRARLRKIVNKCTETNSKIELAADVCKEFPGENNLQINVNEFKESRKQLSTLLRQMGVHEVMVTFGQDLDGTTMSNLPEVTTLFESLCDDSVKPFQCFVEPQSVVLMSPYKLQDTVFVFNKNSNKVYFQVVSEPEGLLIHPNEGEVRPEGMFPVVVKYSGSQNKAVNYFKVRFLFNDDLVEITVKILQA